MYNRRMPILLLDSKRPTLIPIELLVKYRGSASCTSDVPSTTVQLITSLGVSTHDRPELLITTNLAHSAVRQRIAAGECVVAVGASQSITTAVSIMQQAVARGEWERMQTHISLLPYLHEEVAEFVQAVDSENPEEIKLELSDLLLQVLFHAELAKDFEFDDVAAAFIEKMYARAPYLFDGSEGVVPIDVQERAWEAGKIQ